MCTAAHAEREDDNVSSKTTGRPRLFTVSIAPRGANVKNTLRAALAISSVSDRKNSSAPLIGTRLELRRVL